MGPVTEAGVRVGHLRVIPTAGGAVRHGIKATDPGFSGFGEAYFSLVEPGAVKGWKRHRRMTLNLMAAFGAIRVCICDERGGREIYDLCPERPGGHMRLTISPGLWVAFGGLGPGTNVILNVANLAHDPGESDTLPLSRFPWVWPAAVTDAEAGEFPPIGGTLGPGSGLAIP